VSKVTYRHALSWEKARRFAARATIKRLALNSGDVAGSRIASVEGRSFYF